MTFSSSSFSSDNFGAIPNGYGAAYGGRRADNKKPPGQDDPMGDLLGAPYNPFAATNQQPEEQEAPKGLGFKQALNFLFGGQGPNRSA